MTNPRLEEPGPDLIGGIDMKFTVSSEMINNLQEKLNDELLTYNAFLDGMLEAEKEGNDGKARRNERFMNRHNDRIIGIECALRFFGFDTVWKDGKYEIVHAK